MQRNDHNNNPLVKFILNQTTEEELEACKKVLKHTATKNQRKLSEPELKEIQDIMDKPNETMSSYDIVSIICLVSALEVGKLLQDPDYYFNRVFASSHKDI